MSHIAVQGRFEQTPTLLASTGYSPAILHDASIA
jgi:hypothetical protein